VKRLVGRQARFVSKDVARRALLVFADEIQVDLARRAFPKAARPLLDIADLSAKISGATHVHVFTSGKTSAPGGASIHPQVGVGFRSRFEHAIETLARLGYDEIVAIGRDCPDLRASDIEHAFAELKGKKLVLGPDHRGGCYLIGFHSADRGLLRDVRWKHNTDCAQLCARADVADILLLTTRLDLDSRNDLQLFARGDDRLARLAAFLVRVVDAIAVAVAEFVSLASQRMRVRQQMPPPAFGA
jgi:glycosyltransferase A (GT-A) superfamily protein (DUF2064 family)